MFGLCRGGLVGLSPRVRGKLLWQGLGIYNQRSIPACAGETLRKAPDGNFYEVYPRVCGGNVADVVAPGAIIGLSPRVRGKHIAHRTGVNAIGSIPACAGET